MNQCDERNIAISKMCRWLEGVSGMKPSEALEHMDEKNQNYIREIVGERDIDTMTIEDFRKEIKLDDFKIKMA